MTLSRSDGRAHSFFFFSSRRRHTRSYGDWSSDVCSSDLHCGRLLRMSMGLPTTRRVRDGACKRRQRPPQWGHGSTADSWLFLRGIVNPIVPFQPHTPKIGRASCRERVYISVVAGELEKKK